MLTCEEPSTTEADAHVQPRQRHVLTDEDRRRAVQNRERNRADSKERQSERMQAIALSIAETDANKALRLQAMKAFDVLEERLRLLHMKPLPGSLKPEQRKHDARAKRVSMLAERAAAEAESDAAQSAPSDAAPDA